MPFKSLASLTLAALSVAAMSLGMSLSTSLPAAAAGQTFRVDYSVSILGLSIARSSFESRIGPREFSVSGSLASSGIARIFDSTQGTADVTGNLGRDGARAETYLLSYTSGDKRKRTEIAFSNGKVTKTENVPARTRDPRIWVPVKPADLASVTDPFSASLVRADSLRAVCDRTLNVFDGELRADLALSFGELGQAETRGYSGDVVTCRARFVPIGGYKGGHKSIEFLKNRSRILMTFAPLGTTGVYAPIRVSATTEIGTVVIDARRFETVSQ